MSLQEIVKQMFAWATNDLRAAIAILDAHNAVLAQIRPAPLLDHLRRTPAGVGEAQWQPTTKEANYSGASTEK